MGLRSLKVIHSGTIQELAYGFLFIFHGDYGSILYHFQDNGIYWFKIAIFLYPVCIWRSPYVGPRGSISMPFVWDN